MEKCLDQKVNMVKPMLQKKEKNFTSHENRHVVVRDARPENKARKNWQGRRKSVRITSEIFRAVSVVVRICRSRNTRLRYSYAFQHVKLFFFFFCALRERVVQELRVVRELLHLISPVGWQKHVNVILFRLIPCT